MTALTTRLRATADWRTWVRRRGWAVGVWLLLVVLIAWYASLIPRFGAFQLASITKNSLPLVYLSIAQAVIVIGGGIDLSVGAMLVLTNALAAQTMEGQSFTVTVVIAVAIIIGAAIVNGSVGWIINTSKVPDIVVTLATSFMLSGFALVVLPSPGGGTSGGFRAIFTGSTTGSGSNYWASVAMLLLPMLLVALFLKRSKAGLSVYATGSDRNAAYLSGIRTARAKIVAYGIGGAFGAMAGLATVAITGSGESRFSTGANATLRSIAAIVLGGIALTGGTGSVVGAAAAGIILFTLSPILSAMGIDPNTAQVIQGSLIVIVMMIAGLVELRRQRAQ